MLEITITNERQRARLTHSSGPLEFGRAADPSGERRVIMDRYVSRQQLCIEELPNRRLRIENLGRDFQLPAGETLTAGQKAELHLPVRLTVGYTSLEFSHFTESAAAVSALQTISPPVRSAGGAPQPTIALRQSPSLETLTQWFETLLSVQRAAAGSAQFYQETAQAVVELVGLDRGMVVLRRFEEPPDRQSAWETGEAGEASTNPRVGAGVAADLDQDTSRNRRDKNRRDKDADEWIVEARCGADSPSGRLFSKRVLRRVVEERRTFFDGLAGMDSFASLAQLEAVVAAPVFGRSNGDQTVETGGQDIAEEAVVGVVYGSRDLGRNSEPSGETDVQERGVTLLEAQLVQLLAAAVSAGLARMKQEAEAARHRVQLEQFVSPQVAQELERNPSLLEGHHRPITVLFTDLRGFSRISERLDAADTYRLVGDVMDRLTACVLAYDGAIIDYYGDGMAAMWNAPTDQPGHSLLACRAALAMRNELPSLNEKWSAKAGAAIRIGAGIHTGMALVGNAGSRRRLKYGPRGHAVNLASRLEGATKHFGVPLLISGDVCSQLAEQEPNEFSTRRLCKVQVKGMKEAIDVYELCPASDARWQSFKKQYESALSHYETGGVQQSQSVLASMADDPQLQSFLQTDRPLELLRERLDQHMTSGAPDAKPFDSIWRLESK